MNIDELKSCPFCGEMPFIHRYQNGNYQVRCMEAGCHCTIDAYDNEAMAIQVWNSRADEDDKVVE